MQIMHTQKECVKILSRKIEDNIMIFIIKVIHYCELDPAKFLSAPGLVWQTTLKNTKVNLGL